MLWCAGLLLAVVAAVALFLSTLDADVYRRALERQFTFALQRAVSIERMSVKLSLAPTLSVQGLRIANPPGTSRPDFATAASGDVRIDLIALLHGLVVVQALHLQGVDLLFERDAQGQGNWAFGAPQSEKTPPHLPDFDAISVTDSRIAWRRADGRIDAIHVARTEATVREGAPFAARGQLTYRDTALRVALKTGDSLVSALNGKPPHLSLMVEPKGALLTLEAKLPSLTSLAGADLSFELKGEHLDVWSGVVGQALPAWGPYRLAARIRQADATLQVDDWQLSLAGLPMQPSRLEVRSGKAVIGEQTDTQFSAAGQLGDTPFSLQARSTTLPQLLKSAGGQPLALQATLAQLTLNAEGKFAITKEGATFDLAAHARGDALAPARVWAGVHPGPALPADLTARLTKDKRGYAVKNLHGHALGSAVSGDLALVLGPRPALSGALTVACLDPYHPGLKAAFAVESKAAPSEHPLEVALSLRIADVGGLPLPLKNVVTDLQWRNSVLQLEPLAASVADTDITGDASVRWTQGRPQIDGHLKAALIDLARPCSSCVPTTGSGSVLDTPFPLEPLRVMDANIGIAIARVTGGALPLSDLAAQASLQGGKLDLVLGAVKAVDMPVQGRLTLHASDSAWRVAVDAKSERVDLGAVQRSMKQVPFVDGVIPGLQLTADAQGETLRALLAQTRLSVRSAPFSLAWGGERHPLTVDRASIDAAPGGPVLVRVSGRAFDSPIELAITGGPLAELLAPDSAWPTITAQLSTALQGQSLQIAARSGPLHRLVAIRDVPLSLQATMPGAQASLDGVVTQLTASTATRLDAHVEIADLAQTAALFGQQGLPPLPVDAKGRVTMDSGALTIEGLSAKVGRSDATGRVQVRWQGRPRISADLSAKLIDTTEWQGREAGDTPLLDRPLDVKPLQAQDLRLHLRADRFVLPRYTLGKLDADGTLESGLIVFNGTAADGNLQADLRLDAARATPAGALRLSLKDMDTQTLYTEATGQRSGKAPHLSITAQLVGAGGRLREILATSQGEVLITAGPGILPDASGQGLATMAGNILDVLVPGRRDNDLRELTCAAGHFKIASGVATSTDGIAFRLKPMDVLGSGAINLETGQILFGYRAVRRQLFSFSLLGLTSGLAQIGGTISHPTAQLNPSGALVAGTAAWATMGLSLLADDLWRKFEAIDDPCVRIAAGADKSHHQLDMLIHALPQRTRPFSPASTP